MQSEEVRDFRVETFHARLEKTIIRLSALSQAPNQQDAKVTFLTLAQDITPCIIYNTAVPP